MKVWAILFAHYSLLAGGLIQEVASFSFAAANKKIIALRQLQNINHIRSTTSDKRPFGQHNQRLSTCLASTPPFPAPPPPLEDSGPDGGNQPVRWGILGAGSIAEDFAKAVLFTPGAEVC